MGIADEDVERALEGRRPGAADAFELWPENLPVFEVFCALGTQWRVLSGLNGTSYQGLDYPSAIALLRERRIKDRWTALEDLRVMEGAATPILNERASG